MNVSLPRSPVANFKASQTNVGEIVRGKVRFFSHTISGVTILTLSFPFGLRLDLESNQSFGDITSFCLRMVVFSTLFPSLEPHSLLLLVYYTWQ